MAIDTSTLIQKLVATVGASQGLNPYLRLVLDALVFPGLINGLFSKPQPDLFKTLEKKIGAMIDAKLEVAVGEAAFKRVDASIKGLAVAFGDYTNLVDQTERQMRLASLVTQADIAVMEIATVPPRYLVKLADVFALVAVAHMAALLEQVQRHPERYENQMALNAAGIRYSDLAGKIRDDFLYYRMGQIAGGQGIIEEVEVGTRPGLTGAEKQVEFKAWDNFDGWDTGLLGYGSNFLNGLTSGWVSSVGMDHGYYDAKKKAQDRVAAYGESEKQKVYKWWAEHLTDASQKLLQLVDWDGRKKNIKPRDRMLAQSYPLKRVDAVNEAASALQRIDLFLGQQMDQFSVNGPRFVQTYRLPGAVRFGERDNMFQRADTYDTAVSAIYLALRGDLRRAGDLADGLCTALEHDPVGGGRIVAATNALKLIDDAENYSTSIFHRDGATRDVGNASWAGLALTRIYGMTGQYRYLHNALGIGHWITSECAVEDEWMGFSGGEDAWGGRRKWRSVEHNVDAFALFQNLHALTRNQAWADAAHRARTLVMACRLPSGQYVTGTGETKVLNSGVVPTDAQSWTALANIDPQANAASLRFMLAQLGASSLGHPGFKFALAGSGVQNEVTAGAAMALFLQGGEFAASAEPYYAGLLRQQAEAPGSDGLGLVATPAPEADTGAGLGWKYFNWPHAASTAWTGLALLAKTDPKANPYMTVERPGINGINGGRL